MKNLQEKIKEIARRLHTREIYIGEGVSQILEVLEGKIERVFKEYAKEKGYISDKKKREKYWQDFKAIWQQKIK